MFNSLAEFNDFMTLAKGMDDEVLSDARMFYNQFPGASLEDSLKAFKKLQAGVSLEKVIKSYAKYQAKIGVEEGQEDYKRILTMEDCYEEMEYDLLHGREKGTTTYIPELDNAWTWRLGEFNIWTGYANEGKSLFLRFICLIKAIKEDWRFAFYAPEDYPAKEFFDDLIHTAAGYTTDKDLPGFVGNKLYKEVKEKIKEYFYFVYIRPPHNSLITVLKEFIPLIKEKDVKACIMDPLIKMARPTKYLMADDKYAGYVTTICTDFSREFHVSLHLVMHQLTPKLQENGYYAKPNMYYIKGGGTWADGTDNINGVWRPNYARDKIDPSVIFSSLKIKKQKLVGIPQDVPMRFDRKKNRYTTTEGEDLFDFDSILEIPRMKTLFK